MPARRRTEVPEGCALANRSRSPEQSTSICPRARRTAPARASSAPRRTSSTPRPVHQPLCRCSPRPSSGVPQPDRTCRVHNAPPSVGSTDDAEATCSQALTHVDRTDSTPPAATTEAPSPPDAPGPASPESVAANPHPRESSAASPPFPESFVSAYLPDHVTLGRQLTRLRTARGLSRPRLADAIGVPPSRLTQLEHGHTIAPAIADLAALADALAVPRAELATAALRDFQAHYDLTPHDPPAGPTPSIEVADDHPIGAWLRARREQRDATTADFASLSGSAHEAVLQLERNVDSVRPSAVVHAADALALPRLGLLIAVVSRFPSRHPPGHQHHRDRQTSATSR